jgi:hypothetical protein
MTRSHPLSIAIQKLVDRDFGAYGRILSAPESQLRKMDERFISVRERAALRPGRLH